MSNRSSNHQIAIFEQRDLRASATGDELKQDRARTELKHCLGELKAIEGFPEGSDEAVLRHSLPPYYTACPNPFLRDAIPPEVENRPLHRLPRSEDVSAGKNDPLYFAHYYATKVPHHAIVPYILAFTEPGEVVLDAFCGTGMTGVAAQACANPIEVPEGARPGARRVILSDLGPAATFIAAVTNSLGRLQDYLPAIEELVNEVEAEYSVLLTTRHVGWPRGTKDPAKRVNATTPHGRTPGRIQYVVWSDVFLCPSCSRDLVFWDLVFRGPGTPPPDELACSYCSAAVSVRTLERKWTIRFDHELGMTIRQAEQVPVLINYAVGTERFEKAPDEADREVLVRLDSRPLPTAVPIEPMPDGVNTTQPRLSHGFTHVHHFFSRRNLVLLGETWRRICAIEDPEMRLIGLYILTGSVQRVCRLNRYMPKHDRHVGPLSGTLYVSQLTAEIPATNYMRDRIDHLRRIVDAPSGEGVLVSTQSATDLSNIPSESIDYIFTDPPFGGNLNYSELNALVEVWLQVRTRRTSEAVINDVQGKGLREYQTLIERSFAEYYRVLKPGRYITVEFHNSQNRIWAAIQEALWRAGFVISYVRTIDKQKGTTKQLSYRSTVKQDLVITAYKPEKELQQQLQHENIEHGSVWAFLRDHLSKLPVPERRGETLEVVAERQSHLLFDRMVAFYVQRGIPVPLSAGDFYTGLSQRFPERDGMYFLSEQVAEYDRRRASVGELKQLTLFVTDEASAIQWVRQQLQAKPQSFQDLQPTFMKELQAWAKHERTIELKEILEQNFLRYDGKGPVPSQIHSYLSSNYKSLRGLDKEDPRLVAEARDRWYVPDPAKQGDLEILREKALLREFEEYRTTKQRKLKVFRTEAVRAGFKAAYEARDYRTIVDVATKLPESVLQEDEKLLMYFDVATMRLGE